jgi:hypothetical protein
LLNFVDRIQKIVDKLMVVSLVVNVQPQMINTDKHGEDLAEKSSSSWELVCDLKYLACKCHLHKVFVSL